VGQGIVHVLKGPFDHKIAFQAALSGVASSEDLGSDPWCCGTSGLRIPNKDDTGSDGSSLVFSIFQPSLWT
jgi:hypothetical protein